MIQYKTYHEDEVEGVFNNENITGSLHYYKGEPPVEFECTINEVNFPLKIKNNLLDEVNDSEDVFEILNEYDEKKVIIELLYDEMSTNLPPFYTKEYLDDLLYELLKSVNKIMNYIFNRLLIEYYEFIHGGKEPMCQIGFLIGENYQEDNILFVKDDDIIFCNMLEFIDDSKLSDNDLDEILNNMNHFIYENDDFVLIPEDILNIYFGNREECIKKGYVLSSNSKIEDFKAI